METSKVISTNKATVVIQVNPQVAQNAVICDDGQQTRGVYHNMDLAEFFKAQPSALGTVQIMIGVVWFLFGIVRTTDRYYDFISVISGITYWGSLIYISAGSLSVAARNKCHLCVVKASLIMNVISAITAGGAIVLVSIELRLNLGTSGIFLVFTILQFIISICISGFACKATSNTDSTVVNVALNQVNDLWCWY
ncbi:hypothetical protein PO909_029356 [Leuciscus waleckii]